MKSLKNLLLYLLFSLIFILLYTELSHFWVDSGGVSGNIKYIELPLLVFTLLLLYFPFGNVFKNALISVIPILGLYLLYDVFYSFLAKSPRIDDLQNVSVLSDFSALLSGGLIVVVLLIVLAVSYQIYIFKKRETKSVFYTVIALKIIAIAGFVYYLGTDHFRDYLQKRFKYYSWSQAKTIKKNGRFASFIYYGIKSSQAKERLSSYKNRDIDVNGLLFEKIKIGQKRDIYIVILESFIDPRLIKNVKFDPSPLAKEMKKYLKNGRFSYITASIYGGGTSQSEFETLVGIKALAKVNSIEFNTLEGERISGFTDLLKRNGYRTFATIATGSCYYNSKDAYKSIGFDKTVFLEESDGFDDKKSDVKIFDGDMFEYDISVIKSKKLKKPYLLYSLGMYGHFPYKRDLLRHPDVIETTHKDRRVHKIANQFYYRTKALAEYIDTILKLDPKSIIFVCSDHLPPLLGDGIEYEKDKMQNIALLLFEGKPIDIDGYRYYDIPRLILKLLQGDDLKLKKIDDKTYEKIYFKVLSQSLQ